MNQQDDAYTVKLFPKTRQMIVNVLELGRRKHMIHGLVEVDVTAARKKIYEYQDRSAMISLSQLSSPPASGKR